LEVYWVKTASKSLMQFYFEVLMSLHHALDAVRVPEVLPLTTGFVVLWEGGEALHVLMMRKVVV